MLTDILSARAPHLLAVTKILGTPQCTSDVIEELRGILADELVETGLWDNSEPNARGIQIENLFDMVGHLKNESNHLAQPGGAPDAAAPRR